MPGFLIRLAINAVAIWLAARYAGLEIAGVEGIIVTALALGVVNALIRPIVICIFGVLTLPLQIVTLGCFTLLLTVIVNAAMLWVALWAASLAGLASTPDFTAALIGALIISFVSWLVSLIIR